MRSNVRGRRYVRSLVDGLLLNGLAASPLVPEPLRYRVYRLLGIRAERCSLRPHIYLLGRHLSIGEGSFINAGCFIDAEGPVTIGKRVHLAMRVTVTTSTHPIGDAQCRATPRVTMPVAIKDGCWIGANVTILPGVTVGSGCIVGAGAVVTHDCEPNGLYAGVPAQRKRDLD